MELAEAEMCDCHVVGSHVTLSHHSTRYLHYNGQTSASYLLSRQATQPSATYQPIPNYASCLNLQFKGLRLPQHIVNCYTCNVMYNWRQTYAMKPVLTLKTQLNQVLFHGESSPNSRY